MMIEKILNNNVVVSSDDKHNEIIIMGRGIAFKKKCGDEVDEHLVDKIFNLTNQDISEKFQQLLADIPIEHIQVSDSIISYAKTHLGKKLNESIYLSLSDHIYTAIQRLEEGILVKNALLWDIKRFYQDEYYVGLKALAIIKENFNVILPEDEAGFIALHIVNAEMDEGDLKSMYEITKVMQELTNIVKYFFNIEYDEDSVYYYRFITHLKFFAQRLVNGNTYDGPGDDDLLSVIKVKYRNAYDCVKVISDYILKNYEYILSDEERLYLTIHIERVIYKTTK